MNREGKKKLPKAPPPLFTLRPQLDEISSASFFSNDLIIGDISGVVSLWRLSTRRPSVSWKGHTGGVLETLALSKERLLTQGRDGFMRVWDMNATSNALLEMRTGSSAFCRASLARPMRSNSNSSGVATILAAPSTDASDVDLWDFRTGEIERKIRIDRSENLGMCMSLRFLCEPKGLAGSAPLLVAAYESGIVCVIDVSTGKLLASVTLQSEPLLCLEMDSSGTGGVVGGAGNALHFFLINYNSEKSSASIVAKHSLKVANAGVGDAHLRADGKVLATGGWDGVIRLFQWRSLHKKKPPKPIGVLHSHKKSVGCVKWSHDSKYLAAASRDKTVTIWQFDNLK